MKITGSFDLMIDDIEFKGTLTDTAAVPTAPAPVATDPDPVIVANPLPVPVVKTPIAPTLPVASTSAAGVILPSGMPLELLGAAHPYRQPIDTLPVDTRLIAATYGGQYGGTPTVTDTVDAHVRTWSSVQHEVILAGPIPVSVVDSAAHPELLTVVHMTNDAYWDESDQMVTNADGSHQTPPIPVLNGVIEDGVLAGQTPIPGMTGDAHILVYDKATNLLHELYHATRTGIAITCQQYTCWNMTTGLRVGTPSKYETSADAAGLPIAALLARYEEIQYCVDNELPDLGHALRTTFQLTRSDFHTAGWFVSPATHAAGNSSTIGMVQGGQQRAIVGTKFSSNPLSAFDQVIANTLSRYGTVCADNGSSWFLNIDDDPRWSLYRGIFQPGGGFFGSQMEVVNNGPWTNSNGDTNGTLS